MVTTEDSPSQRLLAACEAHERGHREHALGAAELARLPARLLARERGRIGLDQARQHLADDQRAERAEMPAALLLRLAQDPVPQRRRAGERLAHRHLDVAQQQVLLVEGGLPERVCERLARREPELDPPQERPPRQHGLVAERELVQLLGEPRVDRRAVLRRTVAGREEAVPDDLARGLERAEALEAGEQVDGGARVVAICRERLDAVVGLHHRVGEAERRGGELDRDERLARRPEVLPRPRPRVAEDLRQVVVEHDPVVVAQQKPARLLEAELELVRDAVVEAREQQVQLRDDRVLVVARVADQGDELVVAWEVERRALGEQQPPRHVLLVEIGLHLRPAAVERVEVEPWCAPVDRAARPARACAERRRVERDVVVDELAEVGEAGRDPARLEVLARPHRHHERSYLGLAGAARLQVGHEHAEAPARRVRPGPVARYSMSSCWTHEQISYGLTRTSMPIVSAGPFLSLVSFNRAFQPTPISFAAPSSTPRPSSVTPSWVTITRRTSGRGMSDPPRTTRSAPSRSSDSMFGLTDITYLLVGWSGGAAVLAPPPRRCPCARRGRRRPWPRAPTPRGARSSRARRRGRASHRRDG